MGTINPIKSLLTGDSAFYLDPTYKDKTDRDLFSDKRVSPVIYELQTESLIKRIAKIAVSIIFFPIFLYKAAHCLIGKFVVPASFPLLMRKDAQYLQWRRSEWDAEENFKIKRCTVKVDRTFIDVVLLGEPSTFGNGRWMLYSNPNAAFYEEIMLDPNFKSMLFKLKTNAVMFNYPGTGSSSGVIDKQSMVKAYKAMLKFIEDKEQGIGANEIIGYGFSIGGGVQGEALLDHQFDPDIKYIFIKDRTFGHLSQTAADVTHKFFGSIIKFFGWEMNSLTSSKNLKCPEIIIQSVNSTIDDSKDVSQHPDAIVHDGVISAHSSLAKVLLEDPACSRENKFFMGIHKGHNGLLGGLQLDTIAKKIQEMILEKSANIPHLEPAVANG